jgi:hypothetical protein
MDANGIAVWTVVPETIWNSAALEAAARDMVDMGIWEVASQEVREETARELADARFKAAAMQLPSCGANPLEAAQTELRRTRCLYCMVLEQNQLMQRLLQHTRDAFHQAQENWQSVTLSQNAAQ